MSADQKILYFVVLRNICQTISKYQKIKSFVCCIQWSANKFDTDGIVNFMWNFEWYKNVLKRKEMNIQ